MAVGSEPAVAAATLRIPEPVDAPASKSKSTERRAKVVKALPKLFDLVPPSLKPNDNGCWMNGTKLRCVPSFYLLGQVKCGTTDLFAKISRHPDVYQSTVKEQHFFSREWYTGDRYISQFDRGAAAIQQGQRVLIGDGTPDYIWAYLRCLNKDFKYPTFSKANKVRVTIAETLAELNAAANLVLILRDPVQRLWSDFFYFADRNERDVPLPRPTDPVERKRAPAKLVTAQHFDEYVEHGLAKLARCQSKFPLSECVWRARTSVFSGPTRIVMGCYAPFVAEYLRNFERKQLLVLTLDEYKAKPKETLARVFSHIGAQPMGDGDLANAVGNADRGEPVPAQHTFWPSRADPTRANWQGVCL